MKDCDCKKKEVDDTWLDKNDYGDEFLREESFKIIARILRDKDYDNINEDAVFNIKLEEDEIDSMDLEDVKIDYSYLKNKNFKVLNEDNDEEIELLEENEEPTSEEENEETQDVLKEEKEELIEKIKNNKENPTLKDVIVNLKSMDEPIIEVDIEEEPENEPEGETRLTSKEEKEINRILEEESEDDFNEVNDVLLEEKREIIQEEDEELREVVKTLTKKDKRKNKQVTDNQLDVLLEEKEY